MGALIDLDYTLSCRVMRILVIKERMLELCYYYTVRVPTLHMPGQIKKLHRRVLSGPGFQSALHEYKFRAIDFRPQRLVRHLTPGLASCAQTIY
jgi:hypothetical protein